MITCLSITPVRSLLLCVVVLASCDDDPAENRENAAALTPSIRNVSLVALDPGRATLELASGRFGRKVEDFEYRNAGANIGYVVNKHSDVDELMAGFSGDQKAKLVDIGNVKLEGTGFSALPALALNGNDFEFRRPVVSGSIADGSLELWRTGSMASTVHVPVRLGHMYLLQTEDASGVTRFVVRITRHTPGQEVEIAWRNMN
jgi:hypothetical protein